MTTRLKKRKLSAMSESGDLSKFIKNETTIA
jgi:hypothetical protein